MSRYIKVDDYKDIESDYLIHGEYGQETRYMQMMDDVIANKSIDIEPKCGEWIVYEGEWKDFDYYPPKCKCNQCGYEEELYILNAKPTNFCPNCGADMREREGE